MSSALIFDAFRKDHFVIVKTPPIASEFWRRRPFIFTAPIEVGRLTRSNANINVGKSRSRSPRACLGHQLSGVEARRPERTPGIGQVMVKEGSANNLEATVLNGKLMCIGSAIRADIVAWVESSINLAVVSTPTSWLGTSASKFNDFS
jgi:hypothetical protein